MRIIGAFSPNTVCFGVIFSHAPTSPQSILLDPGSRRFSAINLQNMGLVKMIIRKADRSSIIRQTPKTVLVVNACGYLVEHDIEVRTMCNRRCHISMTLTYKYT